VTLYLTTHERVADALRDELSASQRAVPGNENIGRPSVLRVPEDALSSYTAAVGLLRDHVQALEAPLSLVVVLEGRATAGVHAIARITADGETHVLDHTGVGHLAPTQERETVVALLTAAALSFLPAHRVVALVGPPHELAPEGVRCAESLTAKVEQSVRLREPAHVIKTLRAWDELAAARSLSVTQSAILRRAARSAAVRVASVPAPLTVETTDATRPRASKQQRNRWFHEIVRKLDEFARPEV
jgi:hypothetical protein